MFTGFGPVNATEISKRRALRETANLIKSQDSHPTSFSRHDKIKSGDKTNSTFTEISSTQPNSTILAETNPQDNDNISDAESYELPVLPSSKPRIRIKINIKQKKEKASVWQEYLVRAREVAWIEDVAPDHLPIPGERDTSADWEVEFTLAKPRKEPQGLLFRVAMENYMRAQERARNLAGISTDPELIQNQGQENEKDEEQDCTQLIPHPRHAEYMNLQNVLNETASSVLSSRHEGDEEERQRGSQPHPEIHSQREVASQVENQLPPLQHTGNEQMQLVTLPSIVKAFGSADQSSHSQNVDYRLPQICLSTRYRVIRNIQNRPYSGNYPVSPWPVQVQTEDSPDLRDFHPVLTRSFHNPVHMRHPDQQQYPIEGYMRGQGNEARYIFVRLVPVLNSPLHLSQLLQPQQFPANSIQQPQPNTYPDYLAQQSLPQQLHPEHLKQQVKVGPYSGDMTQPPQLRSQQAYLGCSTQQSELPPHPQHHQYETTSHRDHLSRGSDGSQNGFDSSRIDRPHMVRRGRRTTSNTRPQENRIPAVNDGQTSPQENNHGRGAIGKHHQLENPDTERVIKGSVVWPDLEIDENAPGGPDMNRIPERTPEREREPCETPMPMDLMKPRAQSQEHQTIETLEESDVVESEPELEPEIEQVSQPTKPKPAVRQVIPQAELKPASTPIMRKTRAQCKAPQAVKSLEESSPVEADLLSIQPEETIAQVEPQPESQSSSTRVTRMTRSQSQVSQRTEALEEVQTVESELEHDFQPLEPQEVISQTEEAIPQPQPKSVSTPIKRKACDQSQVFEKSDILEEGNPVESELELDLEMSQPEEADHQPEEDDTHPEPQPTSSLVMRKICAQQWPLQSIETFEEQNTIEPKLKLVIAPMQFQEIVPRPEEAVPQPEPQSGPDMIKKKTCSQCQTLQRTDTLEEGDSVDFELELTLAPIQFQEIVPQPESQNSQATEILECNSVNAEVESDLEPIPSEEALSHAQPLSESKLLMRKTRAQCQIAQETGASEDGPVILKPQSEPTDEKVEEAPAIGTKAKIVPESNTRSQCQDLQSSKTPDDSDTAGHKSDIVVPEEEQVQEQEKFQEQEAEQRGTKRKKDISESDTEDEPPAKRARYGLRSMGKKAWQWCVG